jgi:hypothetical protein
LNVLVTEDSFLERTPSHRGRHSPKDGLFLFNDQQALAEAQAVFGIAATWLPSAFLFVTPKPPLTKRLAAKHKEGAVRHAQWDRS